MMIKMWNILIKSFHFCFYRLNDFLRFSFDLNADDMDYIPSTLIKELKQYVDNDLLSDVSFIVEGGCEDDDGGCCL